jgi:hypothetical protein
MRSGADLAADLIHRNTALIPPSPGADTASSAYFVPSEWRVLCLGCRSQRNTTWQEVQFLERERHHSGVASFFFGLGGAFTIGQQRSAPPPKTPLFYALDERGTMAARLSYKQQLRPAGASSVRMHVFFGLAGPATVPR